MFSLDHINTKRFSDFYILAKGMPLNSMIK